MVKSSEKTRILVVDHDSNELKTIIIGLEIEGFSAIGASTSAQAIKMLCANEYAAILIDLMMPEMNGLQLARSVRSSNPNVATILMSAYHLSPIQLSRADTGVVGFVPKPFRFEDLVDFIISKTAKNVSSQPNAKFNYSSHCDGLYIPFNVPKNA